MSLTIVLDLPESTVQRVRETAQRTGQSFETLLAEWVERGLAQDDIMLEMLNTPHTLYSPLGGDATAEALEAFLKSQATSTDN